ncbi:MAG: N-6 DNA methylase [Flavobacteriales bacterium]|nr:N-6 DNA methylase [Flavobacteriales bacterium]
MSAFLRSNGTSVKNNKFILNYIISKENDEEHSILEDFIGLFDKPISFEKLIELFEFVISPKEKIVTGAVYTPEYVRNYIVNSCLDKVDINNLPKICDPACGCAGFLFSAALKLKEDTQLSFAEIYEKTLFGLDIENYSITRSKLLLSLLAINHGEDIESFNFNLHQGNALNFNWSEKIRHFEGFTHILGNPPYVCSRNIDEGSKKLLSNWQVCSTGHPDLYIPFFEIGMSLLKKNGILGYITMNTFFKSVNGRALREYFNKSKFNFKILDFGSNQVFGSKSTYTCICLIRNTYSSSISYKELSRSEITLDKKVILNKISYDSLSHEKGWNLKEHEILNKIENSGKPFGTLFKSRNGIATLKNKLYIFAPIKEDEKYYYLKNGKTYAIEKEVCKDIINPNKLIKSTSIENIKMKVIFPYETEKDNVKLIKEKNFTEKYPKAYAYLKDKRKILATRDKGKGNYENWYAFGRTQCLENLKYKLFFPHITPKIPNFILNSDDNLLFHNGIALIGESENELQFAKKIMSSRLFWFYITNSSRHYGSQYYSLSKTYFKNFGVFDFSQKEREYIINEENWDKLNQFIESKYQIELNEL